MIPTGPPSSNAAPFSTANASSAPAVPWGQQSAVAQERVTARVRHVVQGLPSWEPTPPGELPVRRPGTV